MDSLELIKTFREVAARGSFSRAATRLKLSRPTVSKHIAQLETRFNVRLLNRSTRAVSLTGAGHLLLERSAPLIDLAASTRAELQDFAERPRGRLRVAVPYGLEQSAFPAILGDFMRACPDVHVSVRVTNASVDLVEDGCDVALRLGRLGNDNLIVRRLARVEWSVCAAPGYWARSGLPRRPEDMRRHRVLSFGSSKDGGATLPFRVDGTLMEIPVESGMDADEAGLLMGVALQGLGAVALPAAMAEPHVARGALVPVLGAFMPDDIWIYAAYTQRRHNSAALRAFLDFLARRGAPSAIGIAVEGASDASAPQSAPRSHARYAQGARQAAHG